MGLAVGDTRESSGGPESLGQGSPGLQQVGEGTPHPDPPPGRVPGGGGGVGRERVAQRHHALQRLPRQERGAPLQRRQHFDHGRGGRAGPRGHARTRTRTNSLSLSPACSLSLSLRGGAGPSRRLGPAPYTFRLGTAGGSALQRRPIPPWRRGAARAAGGGARAGRGRRRRLRRSC